MSVGFRVSAGIALIAFVCVSARAYNSEYLFTRAQLGAKTVYYYDDLLTKAWLQNPYQNELNLKYAQRLQLKNQWMESRQVLSESGAGTNHWQGWELQGAAWEKLAFTDAGTLTDAKKAAAFYSRVLRVHPSYVGGIERRALLGLKLGEWNVVGELATRLLAINANNRNAIYLRARVAEGVNDVPLARDLYAKLSADGAPASDSWFTTAEISRKLESLSKKQSQ